MWGIIANHNDGEIFNEIVPAHSKVFQIFDDDMNLYFTGYIEEELDLEELDDLQELMEMTGATKLIINGRELI